MKNKITLSIYYVNNIILVLTVLYSYIVFMGYALYDATYKIYHPQHVYSHIPADIIGQFLLFSWPLKIFILSITCNITCNIIRKTFSFKKLLIILGLSSQIFIIMFVYLFIGAHFDVAVMRRLQTFLSFYWLLRF